MLQVSPSASGFRFPFVVGAVVVELEPSLPGNAPQNPDVCVGHDAADRAALSAARDFFAAAAKADAFLLFWLERRPGSEKSWAL